MDIMEGIGNVNVFSPVLINVLDKQNIFPSLNEAILVFKVFIPGLILRQIF